jgi:hypothetical protein
MRLLDALTLKLEQLLADRQKIGTVTAIVGSKVTVAFDNGSLTLAKNAAYTPTVGDTVVINLMTKNSWFVLCKLG